MSKPYIRIVSGNYKNQDMTGKVFQLVQQFQMGTRAGGYVVVNNVGQVLDGPQTMRISIATPNDYEFVATDEVPMNLLDQEVSPSATAESDEQTMNRIRERFEILNDGLFRI